jgi:hypothetical protein
MLKVLSYNSILSNVFRMFVFFVYIGYYAGTFSKVGCTSTGTFVVWFLVHVLELPLIFTSVLNLDYINGKEPHTRWYEMHARNMVMSVIQELWTWVTIIGLLIDEAVLLTGASYIVFPVIIAVFFKTYKGWHDPLARRLQITFFGAESEMAMAIADKSDGNDTVEMAEE